ncbi:MAG: hypothetical protein COA86_16075 [Kangiella sp.]|nr:MAG: hypothetical protein COA86_16075 [Kangiella sp.]
MTDSSKNCINDNSFENKTVEENSSRKKANLIQPRKLALKEGELRFLWDISDFTRLDGLLYSNQGKIEVNVSGVQDNRHRSLIKARIEGVFQLECQTTFEPLEYKIDTTITYCTVIKEEQINNVEEEFEALLVEDGVVDIKSVIEDELILALPIVSNRAIEETGVKVSYGELPKETVKKKNPFEILQGFKVD